MSSLENSTRQTSSLPSIERDTLEKKEKDDEKKKSHRFTAGVLGAPSKEKAEPDNLGFKLDFSPKEKKDKDEERSSEAEEVETEHAEVPLEHFSEDEKLEAAQFILLEEREIGSEELTDEAAVDSYREKVITEGKEPEIAFQEVMGSYGIDASELNPEELYEESIENAEYSLSIQEIDLSESSEDGASIVEATTIYENVREEPEDRADDSSQGGGGGRKPPVAFSSSGGGNSKEPNPWRSSRWNPNAFPASLSAPASYNRIKQDHRDYWSGFMDGGIIGYFIGHRRGRIKTERKLASVKKSLEKQVNKIDKEIKGHEYTIRKLVKQRAIIVTERPRTMNREMSPRPKSERKESLIPIPAAEIHIGRLVMSEKPREAASREKKPERAPTTRETVNKKTIRPETMNHQEILKESEKIVIDGSSLREIYESQLVGEKGLRRLVSEHEHGGDLREALKREIVERQIDFERDPSMRDLASISGSSVTGTGQATLAQMIKKAESALSSTQEEVAFLKAKAAHDDRQKFMQSKQSKVINSVFLSIIAFLVIVIILLSFLRHG